MTLLQGELSSLLHDGNENPNNAEREADKAHLLQQCGHFIGPEEHPGLKRECVFVHLHSFLRSDLYLKKFDCQIKIPSLNKRVFFVVYKC
jgi:hypothetical protein